MKYALVNCPHLHRLQITCLRKFFNLSPSFERDSGDDLDPLVGMQDSLKRVQFAGFSPSQELLDLLSAYLPNLDTVVCEKAVYFDVRSVVNLLSPGSNEEEKDHLIINFKYTDGDDVFYSIEEREGLLDGEQDNSKQSMVDSVFFLKPQHKPGYMDECLLHAIK